MCGAVSSQGLKIDQFSQLVGKEPWIGLLGLSGEDRSAFQTFLAQESGEHATKRVEFMKVELERLEESLIERRMCDLQEVMW